MNALQYYIIDSFIKDQTPSDHEPIPSEDGEEHDHHHRRRRDSAESLASEGSLGDGNSGKSITKFKPSEDKHKGHHKKLSEYDPEADGDESSTVSSGGSSSNDEDAALVARKLKDLKPVE
ncbi:MAG: hypothetical protein M1819_002444 [Sarea resinae]|nr:MAG: hypothetical protein M1819_002444 [Sarea resinae]